MADSQLEGPLVITVNSLEGVTLYKYKIVLYYVMLCYVNI